MTPTPSRPGRLVILDRDGVINQDSDDYIKSLAEWQPIPGSIEAIARLSRAGYLVAVASNQSGLARGFFTISELNAMHARLCDLVASHGGHLALVAFCPHGPDDGCACRKPAPGLLLDVAERIGQPVDGTPFIGDSLGDVRAALAVGARPILVLTGKGRRTLSRVDREPANAELSNVPRFQDLATAVEALLSTQGEL